tara:strand:+ start:1253 stop:1792 length:540 start_codon:yes stop_codon:yes gene_type:complete
MIKLIGLTGKARSGKDTTGDYLSKTYGHKAFAMAKPIKEACRVIFGWDDRHLHGDLKEVVDPIYGVTPREAMQKLGTEYGRDMINTDIWAIRTRQEIKNNDLMVLTDLRYDNEAELILSMGGIVINVDRDSRDIISGVKGHKSEVNINANLITETVKNNGSLVDLYKKIDGVVLKHWKK